MKRLSKEEMQNIKGGSVKCPYCAVTISGSSCSSKRALDIHIRAWHVPTHKVRTCS